ncbi:unnamed protein product [Rotaria magnacalcarata]|uniref:NHL repeat-containing protein n=1 Tax=Rotaria magnacalcarata TaxID=392030 RepID=A0A814WWG4_9BILA|nr:unnamed protein product [Rotaria magnacalcarata]
MAMHRNTVSPKYRSIEIQCNIDTRQEEKAQSGNENSSYFLYRMVVAGITVAGITGIQGNDSNLLNTPYDATVDYQNTLYVTDRNNHRIQKYLMNSSYGTTVCGNGLNGTASNELKYPSQSLVDSNGNLRVAETGNSRIQLFYNGSLSAVTIGSVGALIIANSYANNIVQWAINVSSWTLLAGDINGKSGNNATTLNHPTDVTFDPMGNMYVVDKYNCRIQLFMSGQTVGTTIAGIRSHAGHDSALLNSHISVHLDSQLDLYVADTSNNRIQKFLRY